ncbi:NAD(P)-dependent oxidoreductase [Litoricolaceae bacterium]|nr:NAD(P)-dependent oxidoreductase [Litorivicinaceae bacterium]
MIDISSRASSKEGKKILVTGGSSPLGQCLVEALELLGADVTVVSRVNSASFQSVVTVDLADSSLITDLPDTYFDCLIHLASYVPLDEPASDWDLCWNNNVIGTINLLRWAENRIGRIVLASSCAIYGRINRRVTSPLAECSELTPDSSYALSKYSQEQLVSAFGFSENIPVIIFRLGYVYGPHLPFSRVVSKILRQVVRGDKVVLVDPRTTGLNLIHQIDVVDYFIQSLTKSSGIYNLGSEGFLSLHNYYQAVLEVLGKEDEAIVEERSYEAGVTCWFDCSKIQKEFPEKRRLSLSQGISTMLNGLS